MKKSNFELMGNYIRKMYRALLLIVGAISAIELILTVRGLFIFDLSRVKHRLLC